MKSIQSLRNIKIILMAFAAIIALYLFYIQVYTKNREGQMIQTRFRVLDQMGNNLKAKIASYESNADTYEDAICDDLKVESLKNLEKDSINKIILNYSKVYNQDLKFIDKRKGAITINPVTRNDSVFISSKQLDFFLPKEFLLKNIDRKEVFEKSLIIGDSSIIYCSFSGDLKLIFQDSLKEGKKKKSGFSTSGASDTLFLPVNGKIQAATIYSSRYYDISLPDGQYKLFLKPLKMGSEDWFIGGLIRKEDFQSEKQSIAPWFIIVLSLGLLLIVLSLPFVKLKAMSRTEMLSTGTAIYSGIALVLGASFVIHFLFFQSYNLSRIKDCDENLLAFSNQVKSSFSDEMKLIYQQLTEAENKFLNSPGTEVINETDVLTNTAWNTGIYPYFDYIYLMDKSGDQIEQISPFSIKPILSNYKNRDYFTKKDEWYWPFSEGGKQKKFRMESIVSMTSGDYKVAFSRPSDPVKNQVIVMTGQFYSLIDPIIPKGFRFCIIDKSGKVWFHSNKYLNQAENFIQECNDDKLLKAALYADITQSLNVSYYNNLYRIRIEPLEPLQAIPLYLVTMYDRRIESSFHAQVFITTLLLMSGLYLFLMFQVIMLVLLKRSFRSEYVYAHFQFDLINLRNSKAFDYKRLILYFFIGLLIYCFYIIRMEGMAAIISIFILVTILFTALFIRLHDFKKGSPAIYIMVITNSLILAVLLYLQFKAASGPVDKYIWLVIITFLALFNYAEDKITGMLNSIRLTFIRLTFIRLQPDASYSLLIMMIALLFGVAPILKFFDIAATIENNISIRYGQIELAKSMEARNNNFSAYYTRIEDLPDSVKNEVRDSAHRSRKEAGIYTDFWHHTSYSKPIDNIPPSEFEPHGKLESVFKTFRPVYKDGFSIVSKFLLIDSVKSRPFNWDEPDDTTLTFSYQSPTEDISRQVIKSRIITSYLPATNIFNPFNGKQKYHIYKKIVLFLILFSFLILFYQLILFTTRRLFGVSLIHNYDGKDLSKEVRRYLDSGGSVMLINPAGHNGTGKLAENISSDFNATEFNWKFSHLMSSSKPKLVIDLFRNYHDPEILGDKLDMLFEAMQNTGKLIILLDINPEAVILFYHKKTEPGKKQDVKSDNKPDESAVPYHHTLHLLKLLMHKIPVLHIPVKYQAATGIHPWSGIAHSHYSYSDESLNEQLTRELNASDYLSSLKKPMEDYLSFLENENLKKDEKKQLVVKKISGMAEKYYQSLLETCSSEEKFVLMDLAFDKIANVRNKPVIIKLLRRGILIYGKDSIILMNDSFRDFLITHYSINDKKEYKKGMDVGPSNWTGLKFAIILLIVALFVFIFLSNQEFLNNLNKLFITLGASIAGISSLLGLLGKKSDAGAG